jgi:hypothetical protein
MAKKFKSKASRLRRRLRRNIGYAIANEHNDAEKLLQSVMQYVDLFTEDCNRKMAYMGKRLAERERLLKIERNKNKKLKATHVEE